MSFSHGGLEMARLPFTVFRRGGRRFFYVKFKNESGEEI
jgi:hypothetical protein